MILKNKKQRLDALKGTKRCFAYFLTNKSIIYRKSVFFACLFYRKSVVCVWYVAGF